jgi:hypothetical protein
VRITRKRAFGDGTCKVLQLRVLARWPGRRAHFWAWPAVEPGSGARSGACSCAHPSLLRATPCVRPWLGHADEANAQRRECTAPAELVTCVHVLDFDWEAKRAGNLAHNILGATPNAMGNFMRHAVLASAFLFLGCALDGAGEERTVRGELAADPSELLSREHWLARRDYGTGKLFRLEYMQTAPEGGVAPGASRYYLFDGEFRRIKEIIGGPLLSLKQEAGSADVDRRKQLKQKVAAEIHEPEENIRVHALGTFTVSQVLDLFPSQRKTNSGAVLKVLGVRNAIVATKAGTAHILGESKYQELFESSELRSATLKLVAPKHPLKAVDIATLLKTETPIFGDQDDAFEATIRPSTIGNGQASVKALVAIAEFFSLL